MKTLRVFSVIALSALMLACSSNDDGYSLNKFWVDIVTVENPNNKDAFFMRRDDNKLLWTAASSFYNFRPVDGQRLVANYTILWDKSQTGLYDYDVKLNDAYKVLTKGIFNLTPATADSIGNDPIRINRMWVGSHFLNVEFVYMGYNKIHFINLVNDDSKTYTDGKTHLEFRHNANNDMLYYTRMGLVSFDLRSLHNNTNADIELVIHVNESTENPDKQYTITYKPTGTLMAAKEAIFPAMPKYDSSEEF